MPKLIHVSAQGKKEYSLLSLSHVRVNDDKSVSIELPYYPEQGAESIYIVMQRDEALGLAARMTNLVAHSIEKD